MRGMFVAALLGVAVVAQVPVKPGAPNHMLYDAQRQHLVLLATSQDKAQEEIWRWDGATWQPVRASGPAARELGGAAYDTRRGRIIMHGGIGVRAQDRLGDTWEWDGSQWTQMNDNSIGSRDHHAMVYDEARDRTVLFGGSSTGGPLASDTWEWDGRKWTRVAVDGPAGRAHFGMAYDSVRKQVVIFGGIGERRLFNDTWAWDGTSWRKLADEGPPHRYRHRMTFDKQSGVIVMYGGLGARQPPGALEDTWTWDGQQWREVTSAGPGKRSSFGLAYDAARKQTLLYGGDFFDGRISTHFEDMWQWSGTAWTSPAAR